MPRLKSRTGPPPSEVAARIKAERGRLGLTQDQVAAALGVGRHSYRQLEVTANPQLSRLIELVGLGMELRNIAPELLDTNRGAR